MSGSTLSRVIAHIDLNASCSKISRRFRLILEQRGEEDAWKYLEDMVYAHRLTQKGLDRARELYAGIRSEDVPGSKGD